FSRIECDESQLTGELRFAKKRNNRQPSSGYERAPSGQCRVPSDGADSRARQGLGRSSDRPFFIMIPEFLSHLKTHQGLPVPFMQAVFDGMPDFRAVDPKKVIQCAEEKVCAICGRRLGEKCYFICGERSKASHLFTDPPM